MAAPVTVGLAPNELSVRGGFLRKPEVFENVVTVEGRQFLPLIKRQPLLTRFLLGRAEVLATNARRPLAKALVIDQLATLRADARARLLKDNLADASGDAAGDWAGKLDLDGGDSQPKSARKRRKLALPSMVCVSIEREGFEPWHPMILLDKASKAVSIEATAANLDMLSRLVARDCAVGDYHREAFGSAAASGSRPLPRGQSGSREYFVGSRNAWLTKHKETGGKYKTSLRTLTAAGLRRRGRKRDAQGECNALAETAGDCLDADELS